MSKALANELQAILENVLTTGERAAELARQLEAQADARPEEGIFMIEERSIDADKLYREAARRLDDAITEKVGERPWAALLAGHLVISLEIEPVIIIPIEKIHRLDDLRRFP